MLLSLLISAGASDPEDTTAPPPSAASLAPPPSASLEITAPPKLHHSTAPPAPPSEGRTEPAPPPAQVDKPRQPDQEDDKDDEYDEVVEVTDESAVREEPSRDESASRDNDDRGSATTDDKDYHDEEEQVEMDSALDDPQQTVLDDYEPMIIIDSSSESSSDESVDEEFIVQDIGDEIFIDTNNEQEDEAENAELNQNVVDLDTSDKILLMTVMNASTLDNISSDDNNAVLFGNTVDNELDSDASELLELKRTPRQFGSQRFTFQPQQQQQQQTFPAQQQQQNQFFNTQQLQNQPLVNQRFTSPGFQSLQGASQVNQQQLPAVQPVQQFGQTTNIQQQQQQQQLGEQLAQALFNQQASFGPFEQQEQTRQLQPAQQLFQQPQLIQQQQSAGPQQLSFNQPAVNPNQQQLGFNQPAANPNQQQLGFNQPAANPNQQQFSFNSPQQPQAAAAASRFPAAAAQPTASPFLTTFPGTVQPRQPALSPTPASSPVFQSFSPRPQPNVQVRPASSASQSSPGFTLEDLGFQGFNFGQTQPPRQDTQPGLDINSLSFVDIPRLNAAGGQGRPGLNADVLSNAATPAGPRQSNFRPPPGADPRRTQEPSAQSNTQVTYVTHDMKHLMRLSRFFLLKLFYELFTYSQKHKLGLRKKGRG